MFLSAAKHADCRITTGLLDLPRRPISNHCKLLYCPDYKLALFCTLKKKTQNNSNNNKTSKSKHKTLSTTKDRPTVLLYNVTLADSQENSRWLSNLLQLSGKLQGQDINLPAPSLVPSLLLSWSPAWPPPPHQRGSESSGSSGAGNGPKIVDAGRAEDRSCSRADRK